MLGSYFDTRESRPTSFFLAQDFFTQVDLLINFPLRKLGHTTTKVKRPPSYLLLAGQLSLYLILSLIGQEVAVII